MLSESLGQEPADSPPIAVLTLSIGIGATTAICTLASTILLAPLPIVDANRLVRIVENDRPRGLPNLSYREYQAWQARTTTLTGLATSTSHPQVVVRTPAGVVRMTGGIVSSNYFEVLGARAMLGRTLTSSDAPSPDVVVLGYYAWQRLFDSNPRVIGSIIEFRSGDLAGRSMTVIGVMPENMGDDRRACGLLRPDRGCGQSGGHRRRIADRQTPRRAVAGGGFAGGERDRHGGAAAQAGVRSRRCTGARFDARQMTDGILDPPPGRLGGPGLASPAITLRIFVAAVGIVLLIVCANVANLLMVRGTARRRELATRLALGASRGRLLRLIFVECLVLAGAGGILGAALAAAGLALIKRLMTIDAQGVFRIVFGESVLPEGQRGGARYSIGGHGLSRHRDRDARVRATAGGEAVADEPPGGHGIAWRGCGAQGHTRAKYCS